MTLGLLADSFIFISQVAQTFVILCCSMLECIIHASVVTAAHWEMKWNQSVKLFSTARDNKTIFEAEQYESICLRV